MSSNARRYIDPIRGEVFVDSGLSLVSWGTFYQQKNGNLKRLRSFAMPMVADRDHAQANLDAWAKSLGLAEVESMEEESNGNS